MAERMAQLTPTLKVPVKLQVKVSELQIKTKKSQLQMSGKVGDTELFVI